MLLHILGIETSCDETAAAIVASGVDQRGGTILAQQIYSQIQEHQDYGGVVPEIAARGHLSHVQSVVEKTLFQSGVNIEDLDAIAVTAGPGLIGGVLVGVMMAKGLAAALGKPLLPINHLEGHLLMPRMIQEVPFPFLCLLLSGGHCQFILAHSLGHYQILGQTLDDAVGETFDKVASALGLPYPGGPAIEQLAQRGCPHRFPLPRPLYGNPGYNLSFSGLKTATRLTVTRCASPSSETWPQDQADLAASFQKAIGESLAERLHHVLEIYGAAVRHLVVTGGVAANQYLSALFQKVAEDHEKTLVIPPPVLCTDNGAMIAWAGMERMKHLQKNSLQGEKLGEKFHKEKFDFSDPFPMDFPARPRWSLEEGMEP